VEAYVYLRVQPGRIPPILTQLAGRPGVRRALATVGAWDVLVLVEGPDLEQIAITVLSQVHNVEGVTRTLTAPVVPPDRVAIGGWTAKAPALVGGACYVHIRAQAGAAAGIAERVSELADVAGVAVLGGEYDLLVCVAQPWELASGLILEQIHQLPGVVSTSTLVAVDYEEPEEDRDQFSAWV
jgi:DNA-binding Lrp family transcriptional regulator